MPPKNKKRRSHNLGNPEQPEHISREAQNLVVQEPSQEVPQDKRCTVQSKTPQMPEKLETPTKTTQVPTSEVLTSTIKETSMPSPDPTPTSVVEGLLAESSEDEDWSIPCRAQDTSLRQAQRRNDSDHSFTISRNSTLNLAPDWSIPCRAQDTSVRQAQRRNDSDHSFTMSRNSTLNLAPEPSQEVPQDKRCTVQSKTPQMPEKLETPTKTTQVPTSEVLTSTIKETSMPSPDPTPTSVVEGLLAESSEDEDWSIPCRAQDTSLRQAQRRNDSDHSFTRSRNSTLNLAPEPSQEVPQDKRGTVQSKTPQMPEKLETPTKTTQVPTSEVLTSTIKETSIPSPDPTPTSVVEGLLAESSEDEDWSIPCRAQDTSLRQAQRRNDLDHSFTMSCNSTLNLAPTPKSLKLFKGCGYGITTTTNCVEEEQPETAKCACRSPHSAYKNTSAFNSQSNDFAERLKLNERGETPRAQPAVSPLPSTSTDYKTVMQNKHLIEGVDYYYLDSDDDDDDLPETFWDNSSIKGKNKSSLPVTSKSMRQEDKNYADDVTVDVNEDMNNNNNDIIIIDEDYRDIDFDILMPREKLLDFSENDLESPLNVATALRPICPTTSSDVVCIDDVYTNSNPLNPFSTQTSSNPSTRPVLRTNNNIATSSDTSDEVIEVPDALETINMSRRDPVSRPAACDDDVQFVAELRPASSSRPAAVEALIELKQYLRNFAESFKRNYGTPVKRISNINDNNDTGDNNENAAPLVNNENTITVNKVQTSDNNILSPQSGGCSSSRKQLGECPICFENFNSGSIASTNCGHVFCLKCIQQSMKTNGKRCPSCRKQLKGVGYHQVFL